MKQKLKASSNYSIRIAEGYKKAKKYNSLINYVRQHSNNTSAQALLTQCYEKGYDYFDNSNNFEYKIRRYFDESKF